MQQHRLVLIGLLAFAIGGATQVSSTAQAAQRSRVRAGSRVHYTVVNLGTLGGSFAQAEHVNRMGWSAGVAALHRDSSIHATLWLSGRKVDLGTLGGPNSFGFGLNDFGAAVGFAESASPDPLGEDFCGTGTHLICSATVWHGGKRTALPAPGGDNGVAYVINDRGLVAGWGETAMHDSTCTPPQVLQFLATVWNERTGKTQTLSPLHGDSVSTAFDMDETGRVLVGTSGVCLQGPINTTGALHATLWRDGEAFNLGSLGGTENNFALRLNERGQVVGTSELPGNTTYHAFLWQESTGMRDLGTLPGDFSSQSFGITESGLIVGQSCNQGSVTCRAFVWRDGVMTDLNSLVSGHSDLVLTLANYVEPDSGVIAGEAYDPTTGSAPAFVAIPHEDSAP